MSASWLKGLNIERVWTTPITGEILQDRRLPCDLLHGPPGQPIDIAQRDIPRIVFDLIQNSTIVMLASSSEQRVIAAVGSLEVSWVGDIS
jgi:hypothetical protein